MKCNALLLSTVLLVSAPLIAAQGHGQGGSPKAGGQKQGQQQGQQAGAGQTGSGQKDRNRLRVHATDQQRDQYRTCDQSMDRIRQQARDMSHAAAGKQFQTEKLRKDREQMREQMQAMEQEHHRFMEGLTPEQKTAVEARHRNMEQIHQRLNHRLQEIDQELAKSNPDAKHVREQARAVEREMELMRKQHREMGSELGLKR